MTATTTSTAAKSLDWFGAGGPSKVPLKANVFATMMNHQGMQQQKELFPYFENGDLVPAAAFSYSLPDMPRFHFFHYNDLDGLHFRRPSCERAAAMSQHLHLDGILSKLRQWAGQDVAGACGQLRARSVALEA